MKKLLFLLGLLIPTISFAQSYAIDWYKIAGGGGTSTGGVYSVSSTIGQHDAGGAMSGSIYSLNGGFWSFIAVAQTAGLPDLAIAHSGNNVIVSWPNIANCTLQQKTNLARGSWLASGYGITTNNGTNSVTLTPAITPALTNLYFRLSQP